MSRVSPYGKLLLYLLHQKGPQPKWIYNDTEEMKTLTKEGYINFDKPTLIISLADKGKEWVKLNPMDHLIDLARWIGEHSFCAEQSIIRESKRYKLIDFLVKTNQVYKLRDLFKLINSRKKQIWNRRLITLPNVQVPYIIVDTTVGGDLGPFSSVIRLLDVSTGTTVMVPRGLRNVTSAGQYMSQDQIDCLTNVFAKPR